MKPEFSEFSYGFAYTDALIRRRGRLNAAPAFPSLRDEKTKGYDLYLNSRGVPIFLQFKLSDRLVSRNAQYWFVHSGPYYRVNITPLRRSPQHNLLKELNTSGNHHVYYVAPLFYRTKEFNDAYLAGDLIGQSVSIPVSQLPLLLDREDHQITFTGTNFHCWHTDEENLQGLLLDGDFSSELVYETIEDMFNRGVVEVIEANYFAGLLDILVSIVRNSFEGNMPLLRSDRNVLQPDDDPLAVTLSDIGFVLTHYFGLEMIILYEG